MTNAADLNIYIGSAAELLGIPLDPAWRDTIRLNLELTLRMARLVDGFALSDEADPAPVYVA
jgi:hypothetical protein